MTDGQFVSVFCLGGWAYVAASLCGWHRGHHGEWPNFDNYDDAVGWWYIAWPVAIGLVVIAGLGWALQWPFRGLWLMITAPSRLIGAVTRRLVMTAKDNADGEALPSARIVSSVRGTGQTKMRAYRGKD